MNFQNIPVNVPSLYIQKVYPNISEFRIRKIFEELSLGCIDYLEIFSKITENGEKYNCVCIHFQRWYKNNNAQKTREKLLDGRDITFIYNDSCFWKISAYRECINNKSINHIVLEEDDEILNTSPKIMDEILIENERKEQIYKNKVISMTAPVSYYSKWNNIYLITGEKTREKDIIWVKVCKEVELEEGEIIEM